ncbi:HigA family addiction module antitoxin [Desulfurobacterium crinifex]
MVIKVSKLERILKERKSYPAVNILELEVPPVHPGEILREEFLKPLDLTQAQLAEELGINLKVIDELVNEKRSISPEIAIKLAERFETSPEFWLRFQEDYDLWKRSKR